MEAAEHFRLLERMYAVAPINAIYHPTMTVVEGIAESEMKLSEKLYHAAGTVHG